MPDPDEMERLRRADPVDGASLPSPTDAEARALFEEITMTDTDTTTRHPGAASPSPTRRKQVALGAVAAALLLVLAVAALARDGESDPAPGRSEVADEPITPGTEGAITPGGSLASCVEHYDLVTLTHREMAFDGTITAVDGDSVSFTVATWFRGGSASTITLQGAAVLGGLTSAGPSVGLTPGTRLLVAGDGGFAWSCGFTQPYADAVAQEWERVLGA